MITKMTQSDMKDFNKPNEGFIVSGRIIPTYDNVWKYTEEIFLDPYFKKYEDEEVDMSYIENICIGRSMISTKWNGYAHIGDIAVGKDYRRNSIGIALLNKAIAWAKENGLCGLMLETQTIFQPVIFMLNTTKFIEGALIHETIFESNRFRISRLSVFHYQWCVCHNNFH